MGDSQPKPGFAALRLPQFNEGARRAGVGRGAARSASAKGAATPQTRPPEILSGSSGSPSPGGEKRGGCRLKAVCFGSTKRSPALLFPH
ncbi:MAG TPA: hypothetical protein DIC50_08665 [Verrucomicrobia subdivision 3 bacterium]|nr:hypothetical protein [Limisphaerales bacterium]